MNLVGEGALVTGVLEDVFPIVDLENLQPDSWRWAGWNLCAGTATRLSAAGQRPRAALNNPAGSGIMAVVTKMYVHVNTTQNFQLRFGPIVIPTPTGTEAFRDTRTPGQLLPVCTIADDTGTAALGGTLIARLRAAANELNPYEVPDGICVLAPGQSFIMEGQTNATLIEPSLSWRERRLDPAETA